MQQRRYPSQRRSQERVELILTATAEILRKRGIGAVTTNSIAAEAGIPVSSIYQYFPNKVEVLCALFEDYLAGIVAVIDEFATPERLQQPWEEFLTAFVKVIFQQETREHIDRELWSALSLFPELREVESAHRARMADRIADILRQLGSNLAPAAAAAYRNVHLRDEQRGVELPRQLPGAGPGLPGVGNRRGAGRGEQVHAPLAPLSGTGTATAL